MDTHALTATDWIEFTRKRHLPPLRINCFFVFFLSVSNMASVWNVRAHLCACVRVRALERRDWIL